VLVLVPILAHLLAALESGGAAKVAVENRKLPPALVLVPVPVPELGLGLLIPVDCTAQMTVGIIWT
jgi:hypothetical protein